MKKNYTVTVKGKESNWSLVVQAKPEHAQDWLDDGLEVYELIYSIPVWVVELGLAKYWMICSNIFNFRKPFKHLDSEIKDK